jgi:hypothetical protein
MNHPMSKPWVDWRPVENIKDDEIWGRYWLAWRDGFEVMQVKRVQLGPRDGYEEVWWDAGEERLEFEPTHLAAMPEPPSQ